MRRLIQPPLGQLLFLAMFLTLTACDATGPETKKASTEPVTARNPQQVQQYEQRMSSLLNQIANQDKALSELRVHQDEALAKAVEANKALMEEFVALRREMSQVLGYETGAAPVVTQTPVAPAQVQSPAAGDTQAQAAKTPVAKVAPAPDEEPSRFGKAVLRLILVIILLAAIWLIIQIFMGRWAEDEDDEDEDDEEDDEDFILKNNSGFDPPSEPGEAPAKRDDDKKQGDEQDEDKKPS